MQKTSPQTTASETRKLAAIMFTDMVGFSRQMGADEARLLRILEVHNQIIQQAVAEHHGRVIKTLGDAFLVDFPSVVHAVQCAQQIQAQFRAHNAEQAKAEQIHIRIGIHLGDIIQQHGDVLGDGVNIASRLQTLTEPDTICISQAVYQEVEKKLALGTVVSLGRPQLKNIAQRFPVYALLPDAPTGVRQRLQVQRLKLSRRLRPAHRMALAGVLLVAATLGTVHFLVRPLSTQDSGLRTAAAPAALPLPDKLSIVVLPFVNMSGDPGQEYFSDGITEDITTGLAKISSLFVIARNSAFTYKGKAVKVQDVSREMGVQYVLEGSVRRIDNQIRVTAQLIDGLTGSHLWAERFDRLVKDIFAVQDDVVQKIVTTLKLQLTLWEQGALIRKRTDNLEAYDYFLRGLESAYRLTKEANVQARQMYEKAIELDPHYAHAYAGVGWTHMFDLMFQWSQDPHALEQASAMAQKAVSLDDSLPIAHTVLAQSYLWKRQHVEALAEAERAVAVAPNSAEGMVMLAGVLSLTDRPEEGVRIMEKAMRLNPRYPFFYLGMLGEAYRLARQYEKAIPILKSALARNPNWLPAHADLAIAYSELGQEAEAQAEVAAIVRISPNYSLQVAKQTWPVKDPAVLERDLAALRKAGLK
jgi:adenylate cyclase